MAVGRGLRVRVLVRARVRVRVRRAARRPLTPWRLTWSRVPGQ